MRGSRVGTRMQASATKNDKAIQKKKYNRPFKGKNNNY
jgi:hypothetical protein